jgi:hypothetical protein
MKNIINQTIENLKKLNKYELLIINNSKIDVRGNELRGIEIIKTMIKDSKRGNYLVYNMIFEGSDLGTKLVFQKLGLEEGL